MSIKMKVIIKLQATVLYYTILYKNNKIGIIIDTYKL